jgi:beta-lactamase regulating signal transducer with metallopeptidase domain
MSELIQNIDVLGRAIVAWSWQLAIFIGFLWLVVRLDQRHRPEFRYRLWAFALVTSLFLPWTLQVIASYSWTIRAREFWTDTHTADATQDEKSGKQPAQVGETGGILPPLRYPGEAVTPSLRLSSAVAYRTVGFLWALGIVVGAVRRVRQHRSMRGVVSRAKPFSATSDSRLPILLSPEVSNPLLYGVFRPVVLLPHNIGAWSTPEERATIIHHERIHFDKKHHWVATLQTIATTVLFFHPLFRWMCAQLDCERELVCDAEILRMGATPDRYAETLLLVAQHAISRRAGVYFAARAKLDRRIELLFRPLRRARLAVAAIPVVILTPLLTLGFWQTRAERFEPIGTEWLTRLLPVVPRETPQALTLTSPSRKPVLVLPPEQANPTQLQAIDSGFGMVVSLVRKPDSRGSEVHIALGIPHSGMVFSQTERSLQANGKFEMQVASLSGRVVARAEEPFELALPLSAQVSQTSLAVLEQVFQLEPGGYTIASVVTDSTTGKPLGMVERRLEIPAIPPTVHSASSLILADMIERGNPGNSFRLGDIRVRPNFTGKLRRDQELRLAQQVYNPASAALTYETVITTTGREVKRVREDLTTAPELTVIKNFPLLDFPPGSYEVETLVTDSSTGLKVGARARFSVE